MSKRTRKFCAKIKRTSRATFQQIARNFNNNKAVANHNHISSPPYLLYEEQEQLFVEDMSRSPPRWYSSQQAPSSGPPMPANPPDRRSPGYDRGPPPDWYRWHEQHRGRSPPRSSPPRAPPRSYSPPRNASPQRAASPHVDRKTSQRAASPRIERPPSPRPEQPPARRPPSPIRVPSPRRERPPSPRRDRPRSPYEWRPRSPPRSYQPQHPHDWGRGRSPPPGWVRRSPPRYGPPRERSPPRHWGPPPPEWDRYHSGPPSSYRRSPPRWGPQSHSWDRRWQPPTQSGPPPPTRNRIPSPVQKSIPAQKVAPSQIVAPESKPENSNKVDEGILPPGDDKDEDNIESFDVPEYDPEVPLGQKYVIAVSGFFCKICHKFYNSESSAKITHCKSKNHYDKFAKWLADKRVASLVQKRSVSTTPVETLKNIDEPPTKQIKLEPENSEPAKESNDLYDPSQPTVDAPAKIEDDVNESEEVSKEETNVEDETSVEKTQEKVDTDQSEQNGSASQASDSETEALITNEVKKDPDGFIEATLYNLRKMRVNQLKANLEKRGLKSTGLKTLLLKRLEKVLVEEAAETEQKKEEEQNVEEKIGGEPEAEEESGKQYLLKLHESDVEPSNRKSQWITDREMERELLQLDGVKKVNSVKNERSRVFNGRRTNVEWTIDLVFEGDFPEDGLQFFMPSHQQLPFTALPAEIDN